MTANPTAILFAMMGNVGSGKSYTASRIRAMLREAFPGRETVIVRSDEVRAALRPGDYTPEANAAVFDRVHRQIEDALRAGHLAIADATNLIYRNRGEFYWIAHAAGALARTVYCVAPVPVVEHRIARKLSGDAEAFGSTAGMEIHRQMASTDKAPSEPHFVVTPATLESALAEMREWALSTLDALPPPSSR